MSGDRERLRLPLITRPHDTRRLGGHRFRLSISFGYTQVTLRPQVTSPSLIEPHETSTRPQPTPIRPQAPISPNRAPICLNTVSTNTKKGTTTLTCIAKHNTPPQPAPSQPITSPTRLVKPHRCPNRTFSA
ncbi:hypothetical protein E2C01_053981 [Portunus trituberculatus]|uniref:Uncharacterized protein n=1 Tax=Portunus trituberculatus TaxID=210409 RepID=A0A5B7GSH3_PORTR|nr:hypothetical protein [Portunus trituberculatus]